MRQDTRSPDAYMDTVRPVTIGARLDQHVVDRRPPLARREPVEDALTQTRPHGIECRVLAAIVLLERVPREIEELRAESLPMHILPFAGANHECEAVPDTTAQHGSRTTKAVVELGKHGVTPRGYCATAHERKQRAAFA